MKSSTVSTPAPDPSPALPQDARYAPLFEDWDNLPARLGLDLEGSARATKAFQRVRQIRSASDLLRLLLLWVLSDWSYRLLGVWAVLTEIGSLSDVAILQRLRHSRVWLGHLVAQLLDKRCNALQRLPGIRLRLLDATGVSRPGQTGADWRLHLSFDLTHLCVAQIELTDAHGGESLARFAVQDPEILLADSGYCVARGMGPVLAAGAGLVVRIHWRSIVLWSEPGTRFALLPWLKGLSGDAEAPVQLETPQGCFPLRLIAAPLPAEKADQARRRLRQQAQRKQKSLSEESLFAAGFMLVLTNLPETVWSRRAVLGLYRVRWQIELLFKRLKGLLNLDGLRTRDAQVAQSYLLAKLLVTLMVDQLINTVCAAQPDWFLALDRPLNVTRLTIWFLDWLHQWVSGPRLPKRFLQLLCILQRYFCDSPRARPQQLAWARALLQHRSLSAPFPLS